MIPPLNDSLSCLPRLLLPGRTASAGPYGRSKRPHRGAAAHSTKFRWRRSGWSASLRPRRARNRAQKIRGITTVTWHRRNAGGNAGDLLRICWGSAEDLLAEDLLRIYWGFAVDLLWCAEDLGVVGEGGGGGEPSERLPKPLSGSQRLPNGSQSRPNGSQRLLNDDRWKTNEIQRKSTAIKENLWISTNNQWNNW